MGSERINLREGKFAVCERIVVALILLGTVSMAQPLTQSSSDCPQVSSYATPSVITELDLIYCKTKESKFVYKVQPEQSTFLNFTCKSNKPNKWIWQGNGLKQKISVTKEQEGDYEQNPIYVSNITIPNSEPEYFAPIDTRFSCSFVTATQKWKDSISTCVEIIYDESQQVERILVTYEKNTSDCQSGRVQSMIKNGSVDCETELTVDIHRNLIYCNNTEVRQTACNDLDDCAARLEGFAAGFICKGMVSSAVNSTTAGVSLIPRSASPVIVSCPPVKFVNSSEFTTFVLLWSVINFDDSLSQDFTYVESLDSVSYFNSFKVLALPFGVKQKTENFNLRALKEYSIRTRRILMEDEEVVFLCVASNYLFMKGFKWAINNLTVNETMFVYDKSQSLVISELRVTMNRSFHSEQPVVSCTGPVSNTDKRVAEFASFRINESERPKGDVACNEETNLTIVYCVCRFTGFPPPLVRLSVEVVGRWVEIVPFSEISSSNNLDRRGFKKVSFTRPLSSDAYPTSVTCNLENFKGKYTATHFLKASLVSNTWSPLWWVLTAFICVVILANGLFIFNKYWRSREEHRNLTDGEIQQFFEGMPEACQHGTLGNVDIFPLKNEYKIPADDIEYDNSNTQLLGSGNFSIVVRGKILSKSVNVAIKIPKPSTNVSLFKAILSEVKIMIYVGCHENLVQLIGICTENIRSRSIRIITEICELGCLQNLLRKAPASFINLLNSNQEMDGTMLSSLDAPQCLSTLDLVCFSAQIANGMVFLVQKNIIHGDLASRNVLISSSKCAKISDFGLSMKLYDDANYVKKSKTQLPWRWMAIESLTKMTFSHRSDVWAYGVTLYEIFSLGDIPFSNETWNNDFVARLESGMRLGRPQYSSMDIYANFSACWERDPKNRPGFSSLYEFFRNLQVKLEREFHCENNSCRLGQTFDKTQKNQDAPIYLELIERDSNQDAKIASTVLNTQEDVNDGINTPLDETDL